MDPKKERELVSVMRNASSIRDTLRKYGNEMIPLDALRALGEKVGHAISKEMDSKDTEGLLKELSEFFERNQLGKLEINVFKEHKGVGEYRLIYTVQDCYDCKDSPNVGKTLCAFDEGLVKSILENKADAVSDVKETECYGTGHDYCKFEIVLKEKKMLKKW